MARFDIRYRTTVTYDDLVRESHNELRACPCTDEYQQLISYRVTTVPGARVLGYVDYWGTRVDTFGIREPHVALEVVADATVDTSARPLITVSPRAASLTDHAFRDEHLEYLELSEHTDAGAEVVAAARRAAPLGGDDVVGVALSVLRFVHTTLQYTPGATAIGVDVNEVLSRGQGVCQDYAHLAVAMCRVLDIPARYVSGYLFALDDSDGADVDVDVVEVQTHAWFEAAIPGWGWLALDPTNAVQVGPRHIRIGHGRDYDDVPPIKGVFSGQGRPATDAVVEIRRHGQGPGQPHQPQGSRLPLHAQAQQQ